LEFLKASALLKLGHEEAALKELDKLKTTESNSTSAFAAGVYLGRRFLEKGEWVKSLESFSWLSHRFPKHNLAWVFKLAVAESLYQLKQYDKAAQAYRDTAEHATRPEDRYEAIAREGDCYLNRGYFDKALASYYRAIEIEPVAKKSKPTFRSLVAPTINIGESYYGLKQLDQARVAFQRAYSFFSDNVNSWRTTLRLGEIFGRKRDATSQKEARDFFYQTINQYPASPGATIARMRLIPCGDHGGFNAESARKFLEGEAKNLTKREDFANQFDPKIYKALFTQMSLRAYISLEDKISGC
jgi:tetratricopeptide (TPR) repeat protein